MNEREPNPEKDNNVKPLRDQCNRCQKKYKLTEETAVGIIYTKQPDCRHIVACCPHCRFQTRIFIPQSSNSLEVAQQTGVPILVFEYASEEIYDMFLRVYGIELIQPKELTPRQEEQVSNYGRFLQEITVTAEDFQ
jgi:hypothetical protein